MGEGILGIDIGGSGIKANLVDPLHGDLLSDRQKIATPQPSRPEAVAGVVAEMVERFEYQGKVGCAVPAIVRRGRVLSAANIDPAWIGTDADALFGEVTGQPVTVLNDADAAGLAEVEFGAARGRAGVVLVLTFGTGIGSALLVDGTLVPNTELGHLQFAGFESVEDWASARARDEEDLSWKDWGRRVNRYLEHLNRLFSPDLFVIGGGVSRKYEKYSEYLTVEVETVAATLGNEAGIVGAAMAAHGARGRSQNPTTN